MLKESLDDFKFTEQDPSGVKKEIERATWFTRMVKIRLKEESKMDRGYILSFSSEEAN